MMVKCPIVLFTECAVFAVQGQQKLKKVNFLCNSSPCAPARKSPTPFGVGLFLRLEIQGLDPSNCDSPVDCHLSPARRGQLLTILPKGELATSPCALTHVGIFFLICFFCSIFRTFSRVLILKAVSEGVFPC